MEVAWHALEIEAQSEKNNIFLIFYNNIAFTAEN
jgi:hypothetical protein